MKKVMFMFVMCAAFSFTACFNNPKEATEVEQKDSIEVVENADSTVEATTAAPTKEEATKEEAVKEETPATEAAPAEEVKK